MFIMPVFPSLSTTCYKFPNVGIMKVLFQTLLPHPPQSSRDSLQARADWTGPFRDAREPLQVHTELRHGPAEQLPGEHRPLR